jgi:hypothetical protein
VTVVVNGAFSDASRVGESAHVLYRCCVSDLSLVTYKLLWWEYEIESRGRELGSLWRVIDPLMTADELADLAWQSPSGQLWVYGQGGYLQPPHPQAGIQCWLLAGDRTAEPVTLISRGPDGERHIEVIEIGGAWAAEWIGPPAECVMTRADRTEQMSFHRRLRPAMGGSSGPGWVGRPPR